METKHTSVEWLEEFLNKHCNPSFCDVEYSDFKLAIQQAKQMHKEQTIDSIVQYEINKHQLFSEQAILSIVHDAEQYYKETYGN